MSEQTKERGEKASLIQTLTARAQDLGRSVDNWNTAYIVLVAITVVLAAGVFIAQFVVIRKSKLLAVAQSDLITEKDRQSSADSKDKDLKIAAALSAAGSANERAGLANERAGKLESANLSLRTDLEHATAESRQKQTELEVEQRKTAEAQKAAADAQRQLNEFLIAHTLARQFRGNLRETLKSFPPGSIEVWYRAEDPEAWRFSLDILQVTAAAKWKTINSIPVEPKRFDGKDLQIAGCIVFNKDVEGFFPFPPTDPAIVVKFLEAGGRKVDPRLAILIVGIGTGMFKKDPSLDEGVFRVVIGPREPVP
ncbi:MAG: hypothetical protein WBV69_00790 [Candidatus Sulfotelmatobacter sp.]